MARSMTGFGRAIADLDGERVTAELSAVNHRFFECGFRMPNSWVALEQALRDQVKAQVGRGKVTVSFRRERGPSGRQNMQFDADTAARYIDASRELARMMSTTESLSLNTLARLEGVFIPEEEETDLERVGAVMQAALGEALAQFNAARSAEGGALAQDIAARVAEMADALVAVEARLPELAEAYEARLRARVQELNAEAGVAEERLAVEVALLADKTDVNEEVVRLKSHFGQVRTLLESPEPIGRDLNFLTQELQREINTLGSKLRDIGVTREVLRMKSELEKLREQVQNIE